MSTTDGLFFSALQPHTAVSTYAVPNDRELTVDRQAKEKRVHQQVQQRLAEKASSEYSSISMKRYNSQGAGINYRTGTRLTTPRVHKVTGNFSSRSAVEMGTHRRISVGTPLPAVVGNPYRYCDASYNGGHNVGQVNRVEHDTGLQFQGQPSPSGNWVTQEGMSSSEHQSFYGQSPLPGVSPMRRSLSGTLVHDGTGRQWKEAELAHQYSSKGPAHRTLMRMNNRQMQHQRMGNSTIQWQQGSGGGSTIMTGGQFSIPVRRAGSLHSLKSVGQGVDVSDAVADGRDISGGIHSLDMSTAISYLNSADVAMQTLGAAYIQHQCYHSNDAKDLVRNLKGIPALVQLYSSENQEVQRYATGATRNLIYENMDNKTALIEAGGISKLVSALKEPDDELCKNVTGILWNLSSKDSLKEKLARESLAELTERVLIPLSGSGDSGVIQQSQSEMDIFYNTTGCLRNLSSVNGRTRQQMRDTRGLVESLVGYIQNCLQEGKVENKGVENCVCVLRNLSFQLYSEIPTSVHQRLEGPTRAHDTHSRDTIGCFTPQNKKIKDKRNHELATLSEVARVPKGAEWLWHPQIVGLYNQVLQNYEISSATREAAAGALQNITAGEGRVRHPSSPSPQSTKYLLIELISALPVTSQHPSLLFLLAYISHRVDSQLLVANS